VTKPLTTIVADDREQRSDVVAILQNRTDVRLEIKRLAVGDYLVERRILFERKTLHDLMISIIDGRLFRQAKRLAAAKVSSALLIQGTLIDVGDMGLTREAVQGALISLTFRFGSPVFRARDAEETARIML
jgi:DNA excision repair protein ERCC-4